MISKQIDFDELQQIVESPEKIRTLNALFIDDPHLPDLHIYIASLYKMHF